MDFTLLMSCFRPFHLLPFSLFIAQTGSFNGILNNFCPLLICRFPSLLRFSSKFAYRTNGLKL